MTTVHVDESWVSELISQAEDGLLALANQIAAQAKQNAPLGKRTPSRARDIEVKVRYMGRGPEQHIGTKDFYLLNSSGNRIGLSELRADVAEHIMSNLPSKAEGSDMPISKLSGSFEVYGEIAGRRRDPETREMQRIQYPLDQAKLTRKYKNNPTRLVTGPHLRQSIKVVDLGTDDEEFDEFKPSLLVLADRPYAWYVEKGWHRKAGPHGKTEAQYGGSHYLEKALVSVEADISAARIFKEK